MNQINKIIFIKLILFVLFINFNNASNDSCTVYIDIQSKISTLPCGDSAENACNSLILANQVCNTHQFNRTTYNVLPGTYSFENLDAFGSIINKSITINNQNYSIINKANSYTSVVFDLTGAKNTLFNISHTLDSDISTIYVYGITFINQDSTNRSSVLVNYGSMGNFTFEDCLFENVLNGTSSGAISILQTSGDANLPECYLNIIGCTYQNTNSTGIKGGFIYVDTHVGAVVVIDKSTFTNFYSNNGAIVYGISSLINSNFTISNSIVSKGAASVAFFITSGAEFSNVSVSQNYGGCIIGVSGIQSTNIDRCTFIDNINTTTVLFTSAISYNSISNSIFLNNYFTKTNDRNGVITLINSNLDLFNCQFNNNTAIVGSSLYISGSSVSNDITISNSTFSSNTATRLGGVYLNNTSVSFGSNVIFENNNAQSGSSIACFSSSIIFSSNSTSFINNKDQTGNLIGFSCLNDSSNQCNLSGLIPHSISNNPCSNSNSNNKKDGLTSGQKAGIAIGIIIGFFLIILFGILIARKIKKNNQYKPF